MRHPEVYPPAPPHDDGPLPDLTSGTMWLATALAGLAVLVLPGSSHAHLAWTFALAGFAIVWGAASLVMGFRSRTMPLGTRAVVTAAMMPVVALALWATGGATSFLQALMLRAVADACEMVVRECDCLARIGGDEFALVAPGAGGAGVERIVAALDDAVDRAEMPDGVEQVQASFAWSLAPNDGTDPVELFRCADERLLARKRATRARRAEHAL
jgi:hypothetical protein